LKLTQSAINKLAPPPGKNDAIFFDDSVHGLGLRAHSGGKRSWIFQFKIGSKQRRITFGTSPSMSLAAAQKTAAELHAQVLLGNDPAAAKSDGRRRAADTMEAVLRLYLPEKRQGLAPGSYVATERHLLTYAKPLHGLGVASITRRDIGTLLAEIAASSGNPSANFARASLSAFFAWCMMRGLIDQNPVIGTMIAKMEPRTRVLSLPELAAVWKACNEDAYGAIVRLLILTGQRREEIGGSRLEEVGEEVIALPAGRAKNRRAHIIPLSSPAQEILSGRNEYRSGSAFVFGQKPFTSWSRGKALLDTELGNKLAPWTLHDLRRSVATGMAELGIAPHIVEAVLNHVSGHKAGIAGVYNRAAYEKEKRVALATWAEHVLAAVEGRAATIVPEVTSSSPAMSRNTVDFPQPEDPSRVKNSPLRTSRSKPASATVPVP
jgi:integrase